MAISVPGKHLVTINSVDITGYVHSIVFKKYRKQPIKTGTILPSVS